MAKPNYKGNSPKGEGGESLQFSEIDGKIDPGMIAFGARSYILE
jgi:hypothetical protein